MTKVTGPSRSPERPPDAHPRASRLTGDATVRGRAPDERPPARARAQGGDDTRDGFDVIVLMPFTGFQTCFVIFP